MFLSFYLWMLWEISTPAIEYSTTPPSWNFYCLIKWVDISVILVLNLWYVFIFIIHKWLMFNDLLYAIYNYVFSSYPKPYGVMFILSYTHENLVFWNLWSLKYTQWGAYEITPWMSGVKENKIYCLWALSLRMRVMRNLHFR